MPPTNRRSPSTWERGWRGPGADRFCASIGLQPPIGHLFPRYRRARGRISTVGRRPQGRGRSRAMLSNRLIPMRGRDWFSLSGNRCSTLLVYSAIERKFYGVRPRWEFFTFTLHCTLKMHAYTTHLHYTFTTHTRLHYTLTVHTLITHLRYALTLHVYTARLQCTKAYTARLHCTLTLHVYTHASLYYMFTLHVRLNCTLPLHIFTTRLHCTLLLQAGLHCTLKLHAYTAYTPTLHVYSALTLTFHTCTTRLHCTCA